MGEAEGAFRLERAGAFLVARCLALAGTPGVRHAFSTRRGEDGTDADFGPSSEAGEDAVVLRERWMAAVGLGAARFAAGRQVHGDVVLAVSDLRAGAEADGAIVRAGDGAATGVRTADCVPILLASDDGALAAAVHAGWRGTAAGIAARAVARLVAAGAREARLTAALGPAVGRCCYRVGPEVARAVARTVRPSDASAIVERREHSLHLDLRAALASALVAAGLDPARIHAAPWCTRCREDLFFSFRRDGERAGRMLSAIGFEGRA